MEPQCIKLCHLKGSRSLEDQDNQNLPNYSLGSIQPSWKSPLSQLVSLPCRTILYTYIHTYIRTYIHTSIHTLTYTQSSPPLLDPAGHGSQRALQFLHGPTLETKAPPGEQLARDLREHLRSNSCTTACKAFVLQVGKLRP